MAWQENASIVSKDEDAGAYYSSMFKTMFCLMAGFLGLLICITPILFSMFVRGDYDDAYYQMPVLFLAQFLYAMSTFLGGVYVAYMKTKSVGITTILAAGCNLIVDVALIKHIGLYAASGSTLISYLFLLVYRMIDIKKIVKIKYDYTNILIVSVVLIVECVLCFQRKTITNVINIVLGLACFGFFNKSFIRTIVVKMKKLLHNRQKKRYNK